MISIRFYCENIEKPPVLIQAVYTDGNVTCFPSELYIYLTGYNSDTNCDF